MVQSSDIEEQIGRLPAGPGIYVLSVAGAAPYIRWSQNLRRRLRRLLVSQLNAPTTNLFARIREAATSIECWPTASKLATALLLYALVKRYYPGEHMTRLRLRAPWFLGLTATDPFPRLTVVNRLPRQLNPIFGPFATRELAQKYEQQVLSLFQIRRCTETLIPAPSHPGCMYGEMNQCLRPCQCAVTADEYAAEARRVSEFLATNGQSMAAALTMARDRACDATHFEEAAQIHRRIEKVSSATALRHDVIREVHVFNGVAVTLGPGAHEVQLWPMLEGFWQAPLTFHFAAETGQARSLDRELRDRLAGSITNPCTNGNRLEELAIFARWYYSSWRDGSWFPFRTSTDLDYRRLVREVSKSAKGDPGSSHQ